MKKLILLAVVTLFFTACSNKEVKIEVSNESAMDRNSEIVTISWESLKGIVSNPEKIIILNDSGTQVPYQLISKGKDVKIYESVIFPATISAGKKTVYTVKEGNPEVFKPQTYARFIPERKDDFAWENDRIAFRMYGPALAPENPSNGVDIWLKRTSDLIVDKFYKNDLEQKFSYHVDNGEGLDCYKVGHTLGAGGIAPYVKDSVWVGNHYNNYEVIENGPLRSTFCLTYDSIFVDGKALKEKLIISLDAGSQLNKAVVSYEGEAEAPQVAAGIFLHDIIGNVKIDKEAGYVAYAEDAISEKGVPSGRNFTAIVFPQPLNDAKRQGQHLLAIADYTKGGEFTYYFGAGWNKWGFDSDEAWFNYVTEYVQKLKTPLVVKIVK